MARRTPDQGVEPFEIRPGLGFQYFRGMNRSADPGAIPPNQFHLLSNVRLTPAGMIDRPGVISESNTGQVGCIPGMIEIDETGIGFWYTPAGLESNASGTVDMNLLGNLNEQQLPKVVRYNDQVTAVGDPPRSGPPGTLPVAVDGFAYTGEKTLEYRAEIESGWSSIFKYRKRLLQLGFRNRQKADDEGVSERVACLWQVELPKEDTPPPPAGGNVVVDYELYQDLWLDSTPQGDINITHVVSVFGRADDPLTGIEQIQEILYLARRDGKVYSFDGTTLKLEVDFGGDYRLRLGVLNEMGIFAIGSLRPGGATAAARFLPEPGGSWITVTLPEADMWVTDLVPWNGSIYISANPNPTTGNTSPRIYRYTGGSTLAAFVFELDSTVNLVYRTAGHFFSYRGFLYLIGRREDGSGSFNHGWYFLRRASDGVWPELPNQIMFNQDFAAAVYWVLVTAQRVIVGGLWTPELNFGAPVFTEEKEMVVEFEEFSTSSGPTGTILYVNPTDDSRESAGRHVLVIAPEDVGLNEEEL